LVQEFFADRIFGPQRRDHLAADLRRLAESASTVTPQNPRAEFERRIDDLHRRQAGLITELEAAGLIADPDLRQEFRVRIQNRFAELNHQQRSLTEQRDALPQPGPHTGDQQAPELLDQLPLLTTSLGTAPGDLQRNLYDAYRLQVQYNRHRHEATLRVTITADALPTLTDTAHAIQTPPGSTVSTKTILRMFCVPRRGTQNKGNIGSRC
jgi:site-specific DNA recombinase